MELIVIFIVLFALIIGSITDLRKREVPNLLNYSLIVVGVAVNLLFAFIRRDYHILLYSMIGLALGYGFAALFFYTGMWGGGDAKTLIGIGAILGVPFSMNNIGGFLASDFFTFLINSLLVGGVYGIFWGLFLAVKNRKNFLAEYKKLFETRFIRVLRRVVLIFASLILLFVVFIHFYFKGAFLYYELILSVSAFVLFITFYLWLIVKSVEKSCMITDVSPDSLTEGDWINKEVKVGRKIIAGPKDLGVTKEQIDMLIDLKKRGKLKTVSVKSGIPFQPSFLIAFLISIFLGNIFLSILV